MNKPFVTGDVFELKFTEEWFKKDDIIVPFPYPDFNCFWRFFGLHRVLDCVILEDPMQEGDNWVYKCKITGIRITWLKWTIKTKKV